MKPFDFEKAKAGAKVCTRDGKEARIICFDKMDDTYPIVALIKVRPDFEEMQRYKNNGRFFDVYESANDLMLAPVNQRAWVVVFRDRETGKICSEVRKSRNVARLRAHYHGDRTIAVRKIEWEK